MALHESVLEEFGLTPLWVRRGMAAAREPVAETGVEPDAAALAEQGARGDDQRLAAREPASVGREQGGSQSARTESAERPAMRAGETRPVGSAQAEVERRGANRAEPSSQSGEPRGRFDREASARTSESAPPTQAGGQAERRAPLAEPRQPQSTRSGAAERAQFDAPPDDDFAWFDDLPTDAHVAAEARHETPEPPAIHTLDWDALSERVAGCQRCRLCEKRTNTVFGVGDRNADWMLIGEAPGENEDRLGEPFVGQAGKLLDNMLRSLTLARDANVYIANVIKCRPPGNRNPEPDEVARCEPYLQRQVALVKPKLIVALGRFAAQSLLKTDASISSLRGRVHEYEGVPVIVTYHPAYLLRSLPDKAKAWADLCLARDTWRAAGGASSNVAQ
ncbi:uracil-DNA glycosylase family protein [Paraburkholderia terricola]|uniref:Type-4 uracil-DNA glycosylase n=1 Tax=Paraburkholderia terricola TaxID=169427 RepID=A0ABU1LXT6_9BURK|nr:uracil-DNA glycosylase family protein [Paraburkholderia terricola]MDR6411564.1 DNA polymerase [Paraburkholderia terricola]MDR6483727.1 DNA polymerase [Paraburkholderia terricola]